MTEIKMKEVSLQKYKDMRAWCREHYGQEAWWEKQLENMNSPVAWFANSDTSKDIWENEDKGNAKFIFKDDKDATMFSLRWAESQSCSTGT